ncbi:Organic solvent tolerance protein [Thalassovita gelatinovora]|uniref:LPS-assembly protein LptD n=1 Tax=Thalassovita gelatinovora TaxID=53501 RepID=A0A0P1FNT0_THAGE|nr:LPS assembly protein LptD [Thalassovita gelatinovora]QIZ79417.1 LPS-assembly protein LptD [Thalassovita gelatinovora]CUH62765.1 Organic solvent tolerance protein [Thalassovita gelatinovora]SEQ09786.1 LPS-assembly protein [Thalassovita gelatinovora]
MKRRLPSLLLVVLLCAGHTLPAAAQQQGNPVPTQAVKSAVLVADDLRVEGRNRLIADGNVEAFYDDMRLKAARVIYDRAEDKLTIEGPIILSDGEDTIVLADSGELDAKMENGLLRGARMIMNQQVQLAAAQISRVGGRYSQLYKVAATSCRVCNSDTPPLWQIRATKTTHDQEERQLYFENAQLRIMNVPVFWLPRLRLPDPTLDRATGFMIPSLKQNSLLGLGLKLPYFIKMGDHRDLTLTPYLSSETRTLELRYRQAFRHGKIEFNGAVSEDSIQSDRRGYLFGEGLFDLKRNFQLSFNVEAVTDRAYLVEYDYSDKDRLESEVALTRVRRDEYVRAALTSYQTLRDGEDNSTLPTIIGDIEYEKRFFPKSIGGEVRLSLGAHSHYRYSDLDIDGRDISRADTELSWRNTWTGPAGMRMEYYAGVAVDAFNVEQDSSSIDQDTVVTPQTRLTLRWPWMKAARNGSIHVIEPVAMVGWTGGSNANVPNEESTRVEFDESNLLALSRYPSYDRRERGAQAAVGLIWTRLGPHGGSSTLTLGQVYRETAESDFTISSGLSGTTSDLLLAGQLKTANGLSLSARTLLSDQGFDVSKAEARAAWQLARGGFGASYVWLGVDVAEDRSSTVSEWLLDGYYRISNHWSGTADWRYDIVSDKTAEASLGLVYRNECVQVNLSLSRRFTSSTIVEPSTSLGFTVKLTGFSAGKVDKSYTRSCRNQGL